MAGPVTATSTLRPAGLLLHGGSGWRWTGLTRHPLVGFVGGCGLSDESLLAHWPVDDGDASWRRFLS